MAFYTVADGLRNLRIEVSLDKLLSGGVGASTFHAFIKGQEQADDGGDRAAASSTAETCVVKWQHKLFSPAEYAKYAEPGPEEDQLHKQYNRSIQDLRANGGRPNGRIFTYVDGDEFTEISKLECHSGVASNSGSEKALRAALARGGDTLSKSRKSKVAPVRRAGPPIVYGGGGSDAPAHHRATVHRMHIMAYTGGGAVERPPSGGGDEETLCTLTLVDGRQLYVSPDFNTPDRPYYRVQAKVGVFQYSLLQDSATVGEQRPDALWALSRKPDADMAAQKDADEPFDMPNDTSLRALVLTEIVEGSGFEYDNLYVHYLLDMPRGWRLLADGDGDRRVEGVTPVCACAYDGRCQCNMAKWGWPFEALLQYDTESLAAKGGGGDNAMAPMPRLLLCVNSLDSVGTHRTEGYACVPIPPAAGAHKCDVSTWRVAPGRVDQLRRFFVGGNAELDSLAACSHAGDKGPKQSRMGLQTVSSGSVRIRFNVIHQCRHFIGSHRKQQAMYGALLHRLGAPVSMHASIVQVLDAFERARRRMVTVRDSAQHHAPQHQPQHQPLAQALIALSVDDRDE